MSDGQKRDFYVYVLFDSFGVPRYVGKGRGNRINQHISDKKRPKAFISETLAALGDLPRAKIKEGLLEFEAYRLEQAIIGALGREPFGPLVNRTDKGSGPNSQQVRLWHAKRGFDARSEAARKGRRTWISAVPEAERSAVARKNAVSVGVEELSARATKARAAQSPERKAEIGRAGGCASVLATPLERKREIGHLGIAAYMANTTPEQRRQNAKRTGVAKMTTAELSQNGAKGALALNSRLTPEERSASARRARAAQLAKRQQSRFND